MSRQLFFPCKCISDLLDGGASTCQVPPTMIVELERDGRPVGTRPADNHCCQHIAQRLETWCRRCWDAGCDRNVRFRPTAVTDIVLEDDEEKGKGKAKANPLAQTDGQAMISPAAVSSEAYAGPSRRQPASGRGITVTHEITRTVTEAPVLATPAAFGRNATNPGRASNPSVVMPPPPSVRRSLRERFNRSPPPTLPVFGSLGAQMPPTPTTITTTTTPSPAVASNSNSNTTTSGATRHSTARRVSERIRALTSRAKNLDSTPSSSSPAPAAGRSAPSSSGSVSSRARTTRTSGDPAPPAAPLRRSARTPAAKSSGNGARVGDEAAEPNQASR